LSKPVDLGSIKVGSYVMVDNEPCRIVDYTSPSLASTDQLRQES